MSITQCKILLLWVALCVASATHAIPDIEELKSSLVTVVVRSGGIQHQSVGIVLGNEQVLAIRAEQKNDPQFTVKPWPGDAVLLATVAATEGQTDEQFPLMILHVPGLQLSAAGFSSAEPITGPAYSPIAQQSVPGDIDAITYAIKSGALADIVEFQPLTGLIFKQPKGPALHLVAHNVLVTAEKFGSPVVNECGQVIAVSIADPRLDKAQRARNPQDAMVALVATQIIQWLQAAEIELNVTEEVCLSAEQRRQVAESEAQAAEIKAQAAESEAQAAAVTVLKAKAALAKALSQASTSEEQKAVAQQALQQAQNALDVATRNAQTAQDEIERIKKDAAQKAQAAQDEIERIKKDAAQKAQAAQDEIDKIKLYGGIASGGLLFILLLWLLSNRKRKTQIKLEREKLAEAERKAQNAIAQAEVRRAPFDCVLEGQDTDGKRYLLKLSKAALGDADGVVLGRNPRNSTFIIGHEEISREHARLHIDDNRLYVHDLGSANGTCVNGASLHAEDSVQLVDGAMLDIGPIKFSVKLIS